MIEEELLAAVTGCPQFVQKPVSIFSPDPQFVQKAVGKVVAEPASADGGAFDATAGTPSTTGSACALSGLPHSVQKTESRSACAPQDEQTGRVTVTAAAGAALAGIGLPHDVQKLAFSST
ncbi:MAG: hypothetical protein WA672_02955 [Candidatus Angelobacter sp.]